MLERKNKPPYYANAVSNVVTPTAAPVAQPVQPVVTTVQTVEPTPIEATTEIKVTDGDSLDDLF